MRKAGMTLQELPDEEDAEDVAVVDQQVAVPEEEAEGRHLPPWYWYWYCYWRWYCLVLTLCATALTYSIGAHRLYDSLLHMYRFVTTYVPSLINA